MMHYEGECKEHWKSVMVDYEGLDLQREIDDSAL